MVSLILIFWIHIELDNLVEDDICRGYAVSVQGSKLALMGGAELRPPAIPPSLIISLIFIHTVTW